MESTSNATALPPPHHPNGKHKPKVTIHKRTAPVKPALQTKPMAGIGYDDNVCFKIDFTGASIGERGLHLFTARHDLKVRLMWNRVKLTDTVTKADVVLEQVGRGYDSLSYSGGDKLEVENGGKTVRWFQHTILFEINFSSVASPIAINLGQTLKLDGLDKINSIYSITLKIL